MDNNSDVKEIDLLQIVGALLKKWWLIVIFAAVGAAAAFGITKFFIVPEYTSSIKVYVNNSSATESQSQSSSITSGDITAAKNLVDTYAVILKTRLTLDAVIEKAGVNYTYSQLSSMISTSAVNSTEVLQITVSSTDPNEACKIANVIAEVLPDKITSIVEGSSFSIVDYAVVPTSPSSPNYIKNTALGLVAGLIFSVVIIILAFFINDTIRSEETLRNLFGETVPVLAVIPDVNEKGKGKYSKYGNYYKSDSSSSKNTKKDSERKG